MASDISRYLSQGLPTSDLGCIESSADVARHLVSYAAGHRGFVQHLLEAWHHFHLAKKESFESGTVLFCNVLTREVWCRWHITGLPVLFSPYRDFTLFFK